LVTFGGPKRRETSWPRNTRTECSSKAARAAAYEASSEATFLKRHAAQLGGETLTHEHASRTAVAGARGAPDDPHDLRDRGRWRCRHAPAVIAGCGIARKMRTLPAARVTSDLHRWRKRSDPAAGLLEYHPKTPPGGPNDPATLFGNTEHQFKSIGQLGIRIHLKACAASGIVNNVAIDNGSLRTNDEFGLRTLACHSDASKPSRIHHCCLSVT